jgi:transposase
MLHQKRYSTDLSDHEWQHIKPLLPLPKARGRKREVEQRELLNAIFYLLNNGCSLARLTGLIYRLGKLSISTSDAGSA